MQNRTLRFKLIVSGIMIVLIPLLVVGVFSARKASRALTDVAHEEMMEIAKATATTADMVLQEEVKIVKTLASRADVISVATKASKEGLESAAAESEKIGSDLFETVAKMGNDYEFLLITDAKGNSFIDSGKGKTKGINVAERDYFKGAQEGKATIGTPVKSKATGKPVVGVAMPIKSASGEFVGAAVAVINTDFLSDKVAAVKLGKTGYAFVLNKAGVAIAHPKKEYILEMDATKLDGMKELATNALAGRTGAEGYVFKDISKIAGYATVSSSGWSVIVTQDADERLEEAYAIRNFIVILGVIFLAATILCIMYFSKFISNPVSKAANNLNEGAYQISAAADEVSSASQMLAEGSSEAASSIEEISSSLEELSAMTKTNSDHARESKALMSETKRVVKKVDQNMRNMTEAIKEVTHTSEETGKIIKTIDEIAFQTNLLALNAAVEAARAGEAGAGFAVVADEVRNLAIRAADAAKSTSSLIENTIKSVQSSSELTVLTQEAFKENMDISIKMGVLIDEITAASEEQAQGIGQINTAVAELEKVTQSNAASAEETASAAEELNAQSEQVKGVSAELFKVVGGAVQIDRALTAQKKKELPGGAAKQISVLGTGMKGVKKLFYKPDHEVGREQSDW